MNKYIEIFLNSFENTKIDMGEFSKMKVGPMSFEIECYDLKNIGRLSYMKGKAMFGLMKMDTIMFTAFNKDVPLFSYDRVNVLKNDTFIIEMYNTCKDKFESKELKELKKSISNEPNYQLKACWYDEIRLPESIAKKNKGVKDLYDSITTKYIEQLVKITKDSKDIDENVKKQLQKKYVDGLLNNGGTSTDGFVKAIGIDKTRELYENYLFGTK